MKINYYHKILFLPVIIGLISGCSNSGTIASIELDTPNISTLIFNNENFQIQHPSNCTPDTEPWLGRRGSIATYFINCSKDKVHFDEIGFFDPQSINNFQEECENIGLCFEGYYPSLDDYEAKKIAFEKKINTENSNFVPFNERNYLVRNYSDFSGGETVREYVTFIDDLMIDFSINWSVIGEDKLDHSDDADNLFSKINIIILENSKRINKENPDGEF